MLSGNLLEQIAHQTQKTVGNSKSLCDSFIRSTFAGHHELNPPERARWARAQRKMSRWPPPLPGTRSCEEKQVANELLTGEQQVCLNARRLHGGGESGQSTVTGRGSPGQRGLGRSAPGERAAGQGQGRQEDSQHLLGTYYVQGTVFCTHLLPAVTQEDRVTAFADEGTLHHTRGLQ